MTEPRPAYATPLRFEVTVPGNPVPKGRPRVAGHAYTPERTRQYETLVRDVVGLQWHGEPTKLAVAVTICFFRENARRADLDNLVKSVLDPIQGIVIEDDSQVWILHAEKAIDRDDPRMELLVEVL
jgi:Holliday junction resolvase RusA-like endonuclease